MHCSSTFAACYLTIVVSMPGSLETFSIFVAQFWSVQCYVLLGDEGGEYLCLIRGGGGWHVHGHISITV